MSRKNPAVTYNPYAYEVQRPLICAHRAINKLEQTLKLDPQKPDMDRWEPNHPRQKQLLALIEKQPKYRTYHPSENYGAARLACRAGIIGCVLGAAVTAATVGPLGLWLLLPALGLHVGERMLWHAQNRIFQRARAFSETTPQPITYNELGTQVYFGGPWGSRPPNIVLQFVQPPTSPFDVAALTAWSQDLVDDASMQISFSVGSLRTPDDPMQVRAALRDALDLDWYDSVVAEGQAQRRAARLHTGAITATNSRLYFASNGDCCAWLLNREGQRQICRGSLSARDEANVTYLPFSAVREGIIVMGPAELASEWSPADVQRWLERIREPGGTKRIAAEIVGRRSSSSSDRDCVVVDGRQVAKSYPGEWAATGLDEKF